MITSINEFRKTLESTSNAINEAVDKKDWDRMSKLLLAGDDGEKVAASIKDKTKAIARYVAGLKLAGKPGFTSRMSYRNTPEVTGSFSAFGNRAIALGATVEEIQNVFDTTVLPTEYADKLTSLSGKKLNDRFIGNISRAIIDMGLNINYLPHNGNALTQMGRDAMSRNGRKWTIGYKIEIDLGTRKVNLNIDAITDEGDGPTSYVLAQSDQIFNNAMNMWKNYGQREFISMITDSLKRAIATA
jgi:hypothetical protein